MSLRSPKNPRVLIAQRNALVAVSRLIKQHRGEVPHEAVIRMLVKVLGMVGALLYLCDQENQLMLKAEQGVPPKALAWLAKLRIDNEPWFVAQRVAQTQQSELDMELAATRQGVSLRPTLEAEGWHVLFAVPLAVTGILHGVLVLAGDVSVTMMTETQALLEAVGVILALAMERESAMRKRASTRPPAESDGAQPATPGLGVPRPAGTPRDLDEEIDITETRPEAIDVREIRQLLARHRASGDDADDEDEGDDGQA